MLALVVSSPMSARAADRFVFDDTHTSVVFAVNHLGYSRVFGRFQKVDGEFTVDKANAANNSVSVKIAAGSVDTAVGDRDRHLRGPDFFNVGEHPTIEFRSTNVVWGEGDALQVSGDLTMLGVTKPVTLAMKLNKIAPNFRGETIAGVSGSVTLKRSDFGMSYMQGGLGDEIEIWLEIEGKKA
jgi:polyisoprenoid-binding protein YceI